MGRIPDSVPNLKKLVPQTSDMDPGVLSTHPCTLGWCRVKYEVKEGGHAIYFWVWHSSTCSIWQKYLLHLVVWLQKLMDKFSGWEPDMMQNWCTHLTTSPLIGLTGSLMTRPLQISNMGIQVLMSFFKNKTVHIDLMQSLGYAERCRKNPRLPWERPFKDLWIEPPWTNYRCTVGKKLEMSARLPKKCE